MMGAMNADQVIALVGVCAGSAVGLAGVIAGFLSSGRQMKSAESIAREERRAARVTDAYADLYEWLATWNRAALMNVGAVIDSQPEPKVDLRELRDRAMRGSVTWSKDLRELVDEFGDQASAIVTDAMGERRRQSEENTKPWAAWKKDVLRRTKKLDGLLEDIRTHLNNDLDGPPSK